MENLPIPLKEASERLQGKFSPDALRKKIWIGEIPGIKYLRGKKEVLGISEETLQLLLQKDNRPDMYIEMRDEWEKAQRHGTHGKEPKPVSEKTISEYKGYLKRYFNSLGLSASIENLSPANFEKCMWTFDPDPENRKDHYPTRQKIYNAVTSFYLHLIKRGLKNEGELAAIRRLRPKQTYPEKRRVLTDEQWKTLFKANDFLKGRTEFDKELSQTLLLLYTTAGLRRSEAIRLEVDWINLQTGQMEILGKNNKWRTVFANGVLLAQIRKWIEKHRPVSKGL